jgi:hypothetical protein
VKQHLVYPVICLLAVCLAASAAAAAVPPIQPGSWTLAILPDTQYYTRHAPDIFYGQTQFLADNKTNLNIKYVLHEGDVTKFNSTDQWQVGLTAMNTLQNAGIGYSITTGNHDYEGNSANRNSYMPDYFPVSKLDDQPTFGGVYPYEPTLPYNSYSLFSAGGTDWLVLALEWGPRNQIVNWADAVLKAYPNRQAMIVTHSYLYYDGTIMDHNNPAQEGNPHEYGIASLPGGVNDGLEMWNKLKDNPNLLFVFNGHSTNPAYDWLEDPEGAGAYLASTADDGHTVHQMIANYQNMPDYGQGWLRLLEFQTDGEVHVRTYSTYLDQSMSEPNQDFVITIPEPATLTLFITMGLVLAAYFRRRRGRK